MAKVVIIIPTYNEKDNTQSMIDALAKIVASVEKHTLELLYVDGNSPDGTSEIIKSNQKLYKWLHLLMETKKEGLGMAYAKGMQHAIASLSADYVMEFDADFQHQPADIPRLIAQIDNGYDYIIGSRYVSGGSIPNEWGWNRKLLSVVGNLVARIVLVLPHIHDVTGGFKLTRVKGFLDEFDFSKLLSRSFAYKIHLLFYMVGKKAKVVEIPIQFQNRTQGESKIIKNEMAETLRVLFLLQYHNPQMRKFFKFATVGFIGYLINATTLALFTTIKLAGPLAWGFSTELAIISNFLLNNLWTFKDIKIMGSGKLIAKFIQFNFTSTGGLLIQVVVGVVTDRLFGPSYRQLVLPLSIAFLVLPYNYLMYTLVIWKSPKTAEKLSQ